MQFLSERVLPATIALAVAAAAYHWPKFGQWAMITIFVGMAVVLLAKKGN